MRTYARSMAKFFHLDLLSLADRVFLYEMLERWQFFQLAQEACHRPVFRSEPWYEEIYIG